MDSNIKLFNKNFFIMAVSSFLMYFAFFLVMPIIAMYVIDEFNVSVSVAGVVVSVYIITALITRPFSGYLVDRYDRRTLYILSYIAFGLLFIGYVIANSVMVIVITRILLGATFSCVGTAANTLAIDVMPSNRRSEGIGYFGALTVIAMAVGPMTGLYLLDLLSYNGLFTVATISCFLGIIIAYFVYPEKVHTPVKRDKLSFDRFFLKRGASIAAVIALIYFLQGALTAYVALYVKDSGLEINSGNFFLIFAAGIIVSRLYSAKLLSKGRHEFLIQLAMVILVVGLTLFIFFISPFIFPIASLLLGIGFGLSAPTIQSQIVELVPHNKRGTATSTYFIALDLGSGIGMLLGGIIAGWFGYKYIYIFSMILVVISFFYYKLYAQKNYRENFRQSKCEMES